jgi:hypothetical protein
MTGEAIILIFAIFVAYGAHRLNHPNNRNS